VESLPNPRRISPANPTWHPLRIKLPTEIAKIPYNSFSIKHTKKNDNEFEQIDQRSVYSHYRFMRATTNPTWLKKETPHLLEIQNTNLLQY